MKSPVKRYPRMEKYLNKERNLKDQVREFWDEQSCGEVYASGTTGRAYYESQAFLRYNLEPYILNFAKFEEGHNKDVLEIGIGMGADHIEWAKSGPRSLTGVDITPRSIEHVRDRLNLYYLSSDIQLGDAEKLSFDDSSFDLVYSWGVLHHSPNTPQAIDEVYRVLRKGGTTRVMIYHKYSLVGGMLWIRYGLLKGRPFRSWGSIYANHLESPGTKAYSVRETRNLFAKFSEVHVHVQLSFGDLLDGEVGQQHKGVLLTWAKQVWPRKFIGHFLKNYGLYLCIEAKK